MLIRITAPHFCAGIDYARTGVRLAPILRYMRGWTVREISAYCRQKGWTFQVVCE